MAYTLLQIAASYDRPVSTTCLHIKQLQKEKKFIKKSPGKQYSERELHELENLMDFKFKRQDF